MMIKQNLAQNEKSTHKYRDSILREFLENNYEMVINMIGWDYDPEVERQVIRREAREDGFAEGRVEGLEQGLEEGLTQGIEQGEKSKAIEIAKNFLDMGIPIENIAKGSGLSIEEIKNLTPQKGF